MGPKLERLTYVYADDPGVVGQLIRRFGSQLRFGSDGSGLFEIEGHRGSGGRPIIAPTEEVVPITAASIDDLLPELRDAVREQVPCILGHAEGKIAMLVRPSAIKRLNGTPSDLRGKVRFGLARLEWRLR